MRNDEKAKQFWADPTDPRHGTVNGYVNLECRCTECRRAWSAACKVRRLERRERLAPDDPRHGKPTTYYNHACRCDLCRDAKRQQDQERRERRAFWGCTPSHP